VAERIASKVLLVGWDAADWRVIHPLMDAGKMPNLQRLVERGVMGNLATLHPVLSPMLWTSIATGKRPPKHGILGFTEPTPDGAAVRPVSSLSRTTKAFWNILHQQGLRSHVIGWWPSAPVEPIDGVMVSNHFHHAVGPLEVPWPLPPASVHPARLRDTLAELRFHPCELTPEQVLAFVPRAAEIDQDRDRRLAMVMKTLAECATVNNAATWALANEPWDVAAVYFDAIDHFCHGFMKYHPPRRPFVPERDFELYSGVVEAGYRFHDLMLGALLAETDADTTVILCSDHGFHPDHNRPAGIPSEPAGPAVEHRDFGILAMAGPGIRRDELVHGACLLDVTPTLLALLGLPIGEDMDGKPLLQAFERPPEIETIPSWDAVPGDAAMHPPDAQTDPIAAKEALDQLVALGYIEPLGEDRAQAVARSARELRYNLARSYMDADHHAEASLILSDLYDESPDEHRFGLRLAMCYRALDWIAPLRSVVERMHERRVAQAEAAREQLRELERSVAERGAGPGGEAEPAAPPSDEERARWRALRSQARVGSYDVEYLRGYVAAAEGDHEAALAHLLEAERAEPGRPGLHIQIGEAYLQLGRAADAERAFDKASAIDGENPHAHLGLARSFLAQRDAQRAAQAAVRAVGLLYHYPMAHYVLGQALARLRRHDAAAKAFEVAIALNPHFAEAHRKLAGLYARQLSDPDRARHHRQLARAMRRATPPAPQPGPARDAPETAPSAAHLGTLGAAPRAGEPFVTVVTGLPRSGTSMMMQMLAAGGVPVLTDGAREADEDNPRGYYELEAATRLRSEDGWVAGAVGHAFKLVAQLVPRLPAGPHYRLLFMRRDLEEVLASQQAMLERSGRDGSRRAPERLRRAFQQQLQQVEAWIARQENTTALLLDYGRVVADPQAAAAAIGRFLGRELDVAAMARAVDPALHRRRAGARRAPGTSGPRGAARAAAPGDAA
jgi:predicted AlkP superfamily phosphohydrolase/phosphomutase/tetratricopeptide (TPR) repeat protein